MSFELVPIDEAETSKNGQGRDSPNNFPVL